MTSTRNLLQLASRLISRDGFNATHLDRVRLFRSSAPIARQPILYDPWLVVMLQGEKSCHLPDRTIRYAGANVLCAASGAPFDCEALATPRHPIVAMTLDVRIDELLSLAARMPVSPVADADKCSVVHVQPLDDALHDAIGRLLRALHDPTEAAILGEPILTEITYRVLQGGLASSLAALAASKNSAAVLQSLRVLHEDHAKPIAIDRLAARVHMSPSAFHLHFRRITGYSPLQYLKRIRLGKSRQMIQGGQATVTEAAHHVGYESAPQFSREYKRHFGVAPSHDAPKSEASAAQ